ncbi:uncharacterized protein LOC111866995 isoform X3 [Cryptotermes secundus]|uniref:uncharacterized protein LOC111866995 isoform X3 n=1 Tax=Cryptotermes secundus TaxID=105785 RepID=UPI000CD7C107|nr:uncharacterized protein LOC111866995 isoform X3 [Cryptotermes secundus]
MVLQCSMDLMKVECGQDGELCETPGRECCLIEVKEEMDPLLTFSELKTEAEHVKVHMNAKANSNKESECKHIDVKEEKDPLLIIVPFMKAENEPPW